MLQNAMVRTPTLRGSAASKPPENLPNCRGAAGRSKTSAAPLRAFLKRRRVTLPEVRLRR
ncbi:hypothetical protein GCM10009548_05440 [Streptomyces malaysiensis subsp. malaysiensis]